MKPCITLLKSILYGIINQKAKVGATLKEKLYTIPVNEAFDADCECPLCQMKKTLETDAIDFTMGSSYMEEHIRLETDKVGFCSYHIPLLYKNQNRLGLALILKSHMDKTIKDLEKLSNGQPKLSSPSLFKKKEDSTSAIRNYTNKLEASCYVCNRIESFFERYIITIFYMYQNDSDFREKLRKSKGFCTTHYGILYDMSSSNLSKDKQEMFIKDLNHLYIENMKRVRDDLDWFIDKFDYRYTNEPWKNSKDALIRTVLKTNGVMDDLL